MKNSKNPTPIVPLALAALVLAACHSHSGSGPAQTLQPEIVNTGLAVERVFGTGDLCMAIASEQAQDVDLDGDGDALDLVLHLLDLSTGALTDTHLAVVSDFLRDDVAPPQFLCDDALAAFQVSELQSGADLDHDGTPNEIATWIYDRGHAEFHPLPFAHRFVRLDGDLAAFLDDATTQTLQVFDARDGSLTPLVAANPLPAAVAGRTVAFTSSEQGLTDLNADGDKSDDLVLQLYDADSKTARDTLFDMAGFGELRMVHGFAGFPVSEVENGAVDLDGDGDEQDRVFVAVQAATGLTRILPLHDADFADQVSADPDRFLLNVSEDGIDRNGDGDGDDRVAVVYDPVADRLIDTGLASRNPLVRTGRWLGVAVEEADQGGVDLDGDGTLGAALFVVDLQSGARRNLGTSGFFLAALDDQLLASHFVFASGQFQNELVVWDARTRTATHTAIDLRSTLGSTGDVALGIVREHEDMNGDGDAEDLVLALYDGRTKTLRNLGITWAGNQAHLGSDGRGTVAVRESLEGRDLNGDGDQFDDVLHTLQL